MLDIKFIRENPREVKNGCQKKQVDVDIDRLLKIDKKKRKIQMDLEKMLAEKNQANKKIIGAKNKKEKQGIILKMKEVDKRSDAIKEKLKKTDNDFGELMRQIPCLPLEDVLSGKSEADNIVLKKIGKPKKFNFKPLDHLDIGEKLGIIDVKRAVKISGTRFGFLEKKAVLLEFALINFVLDELVGKGFTPVVPPILLKEKMAMGTGYFESVSREEAYFMPKDDLYLAGTSEQPLIAMRADEILEERDLPKRYLGISTCFRREAGSYGKDTKGIFRVHQFDKLEMVSFCKPENSKDEYMFLLDIEEKLMQALEIPYRVVQVCAGDLGFPAASTYDIEAWMPSQKQYRETHSCSNCVDFQARRLNIRYKSKTGKINYVHILNGTAFAIGRILIAIIENYQEKDGTIKIPKVLEKYLRFKSI
ncbi:MAG: serine--tRNA ligase [Patescibacteria group bacterium]|nr:serine--tRNA ligase [Patescibacteria group bacterium]